MYIPHMFRPAGMGMWLFGAAVAAPCAAQPPWTIAPDTLLTAVVPLDGTVAEPTFTFTAFEDTAFLVWRRIALDVPAGWTCDACDTGECYGGVPIGADFPPIAPGGTGFFKLILTSPGTEGSGSAHLYVHPVGAFDLGQDLHIVFGTAGALGVAAAGRDWTCRVAGGVIHLTGLPSGTPVELRDLTGRCVARTHSDGLAHALAGPHGPAGIYLLTCWLPSGPSTLKIALR